MRIAIVHEWITARAGSELCFERIAQLFPDADLFALSWDRDVPINVDGREIRTTFLDRPCQSERGRALLLPIMWSGFRALDVNDYDLVISSTHAFSRAFPTNGATHLSYTYTPMRYVWYPETDQRAASALLSPARAALKRVDRRYANTVTSFAGISTIVASRIEETYEREARVVFPPCDTEYFDVPIPEHSTGLPTRDYVLSVGRLIPYKRHDIAIEVGATLDIPVVIAGQGPDLPRLRHLADQHGGDVTFAGPPPREKVRSLYQNALFTVFPPNEDFGIVPVESLACGTPVLALDAGGAKDTVPAHVGVRSHSQHPGDMIDAAHHLLDNLPDSAACRRWAENFSSASFDAAIKAWVLESA